MLYARCTALQVETTAVIADFLRDEPSARDVTGARLQALPPVGEGTPLGAHGLRIAAGSAGMDGFYYALLEKPHGPRAVLPHQPT